MATIDVINNGVMQTNGPSNPVFVSSPDGSSVTGTITSNQSVSLATTVGGYSTFGFSISGTWAGLIVLEATVDGTNWYPTTATPMNSSAVGAFTANAAGQGSFAGLTGVRFRGNTVTSGTATITLRPSATVSTVMQDNLHWSTNVDQLNGNQISVGVGPSGTGVARVIEAGRSYSNITTATTTTVKSGSGGLRAIIVNTAVASATITIYDSLTASGTKIGTITLGLTAIPLVIPYDIAFNTGLTVVTSGAIDLTVAYA